MRRFIEEYIKKCDSCEDERKTVNLQLSSEKWTSQKFPFDITSMDITGHKQNHKTINPLLLTFIDNFSKYVEAFPIPDMTAQTVARVYATQIVTRHGTGSKLVTDEGRNFMSAFFKETWREF